MTAPSDDAPPRRAGRPRADARSVSGDPTDEILAAASRLIGELGVGGTPMSRIAQEVGLKQSSLYYYFRRKEEILAALVARANVVPLELLAAISADGDAPAVQLYRFVRADAVALCALPFDINDIHRIAMRDPVEFASYWKERASLERQLATIVRRGTAEGSLRKVDARLTALTLLANDEGAQNWFRLGSKWSTAAIGGHLAELAVAGLLVDPADLATTRRRADELDART
ncbi:TetR/AcrR family transcriptional regulator [Aquihabitans sp. G128]|uniref:TetR/AcrR family transcriptional regulator n=1 Tax=Aquihabitans sp. G128 TaxID=2849779 RepID=UPI001C21CE31|nr:TetR/AcrR family transcriptional regulator [Aquihabitans sp. G128]QXC62858.1 TetR/AcrR family transcriptional regulator [Aquihabitans sp. G128]